MKINMFVVSLLAMVKTLAVSFGTFFLMLLVFNDHLEWNHREEDIFLYIFLGLFLHGLACVAYVFAILLPSYFIDRKMVHELDPHAVIVRHAPLITLINAVFAFLAVLIAGREGMSEGLVQANFFNAFVMVYSGLVFFSYQVRSAIDKLERKTGAVAS